MPDYISDSDFQEIDESEFREIQPQPKAPSTAIDRLLSLAGISTEEIAARGRAGAMEAALGRGAERFKAGLMNRPSANPQGFDAGDIPEAAGRYGPGIAGGMLGSFLGPGGTIAGKTMGPMLGRAVGSFVGGAAARAGQNVLEQGSLVARGEQPKSFRDLTVEPLQEGAAQSAYDMLIGLKGSKKAIEQGAKLMRGTSGVKTDIAEQAIRDIGVFFRAKPVKEAGELYGKWAENAGLKSGEEGFRLVFKKGYLSDTMGVEAAEAIAKKGASLSDQELFSYAQAIRNLLQAPKFAAPKAAMNEGMLIRNLAKAEDILEARKPGFGAVSKVYREAVVNEAFNELGPQNLNKSFSVLRMVPLAMSAEEGYSQYREGQGFDPIALLSRLAILSPLANKAAMMATHAAAKTRLPQTVLRGMASEATRSKADDSKNRQ